jgi:hypothetical protein
MDLAGKVVGMFSVASAVIRAWNAGRVKVPSLTNCITSGVTKERAGCKDGFMAMRLSNWSMIMQTMDWYVTI